MLTSIILALSVSATPAQPADTLDLLQQNNNNTATPEVVARKSVRIARKSVRIARKSVRIARKSVRIEDNGSAITTSL
ncbi:hypothetical protein [Thalassotalea profundi]|uniref:Uncharacterized protein n=1 Tax=Thalassotalea profundi TaxID=2036687 RepID=A0ABQ3IG99_9GAMM|nr:hypothetical protein [Thalassotalea profundi]GHE80307.1 hypothetical protein GCM10011501_05220 [Thalassotalea profundi]